MILKFEEENLLKLKKYHSEALTKINRRLLEIEREKNENLASKTGVSADADVPLHPPVEHPDQGTPPTNRRASSRRGSRKLSNPRGNN